MEESRGGFEVRRIQIVYFLCRNGKIEQPHLIRVHHLNRSGVRLRDVKRWLSELRGKVLPESFAWSYKRRYRGGYLWQDLTDDDLITAISDNEYVLKGSLFPSLNKTMDPFFDQNSTQNKEQAEETEQQPKKTTPETLQMEDNNWTSEEMNRKTSFFGMESIWQKERNRGVEEEQKSSVAVVPKKKEGSNSNGDRKATNVMRNFIGCMTVETKGSHLRAVEREDSSMSGSSEGSSSSSSMSVSSSSSIYREKPSTVGRASTSEASRSSTGSFL